MLSSHWISGTHNLRLVLLYFRIYKLLILIAYYWREGKRKCLRPIRFCRATVETYYHNAFIKFLIRTCLLTPHLFQNLDSSQECKSTNTGKNTGVWFHGLLSQKNKENINQVPQHTLLVWWQYLAKLNTNVWCKNMWIFMIKSQFYK